MVEEPIPKARYAGFVVGCIPGLIDMKTPEQRMSYNVMHELTGVARTSIIRNASVLFEMLENIGMNSND